MLIAGLIGLGLMWFWLYLRSPSSADAFIEEMLEFPNNFEQRSHYMLRKSDGLQVWTANTFLDHNWYGDVSYQHFGLNGTLRFSRAYKQWSSQVIRNRKEG
jgi:hypothetical protein